MTTAAALTHPQDRIDQLMDRGSDLFNPILVKEVRQALKSRQFIITFLLLLGSAWIVTVGGLAWTGPMVEYTPAGYRFFMGYYFVLCVAAHIIVPIAAYRSLLAERDFNTFDLLSITLLKPRQMVWGKLLGALLQVLMFFSAIAPFVAFTSLMDGFDLPRALLLMGGTLCLSLGSSMLGLMLATVTRQRHLQGIVSMMFLGGLVSGFFAFQAAVVGENAVGQIDFDGDFWRVLGTSLLIGVSYVLLFQEVAVSQLTFESDNRSSGVRIIATVQYLCWLIGLPLAARHFTNGAMLADPVVSIYCVGAALHWTALGLSFVVEPDPLSRRLKRRLPANGLVRLLIAPWLPGGSRGFLLLLVQLMLLQYAVGFLIWGLGWIPATEARRTLLLSFGCAGYVLFYLGLGSAIGRLFSSILTPPHVRVVTLLLFAFGVVTPYFPMLLMDRPLQNYQLTYALNPMETLSEVYDHGTSNEVSIALFLLLIAVSLIVAWQARYVVNGLLEVWSPRIPPELHLDPPTERSLPGRAGTEA